MGRPFVGKVSDTKGREDNVVIRRSIFRSLKNLYSREDHADVIGEQFSKSFKILDKNDKNKVQEIISIMRKCTVRYNKNRRVSE